MIHSMFSMVTTFPYQALLGFLFLWCCGYAVVLELCSPIWEEDVLWIEVALGTLFCLAPAFLASRLWGVTWQEYEALVFLGFIVGGIPIIVWQIVIALRRRNHRRRFYERLHQQRDYQEMAGWHDNMAVGPGVGFGPGSRL